MWTITFSAPTSTSGPAPGPTAVGGVSTMPFWAGTSTT